MERGALGIRDAGRRPRGREVGLLGEVIARIDVPVAGRDHEVVSPCVIGEVVRETGGHLGATGHGE